ncbi:MAG: (d)CMP kinase [Lachnospiraceae bacterium]|nr:(d)CMP kinase [Lachnospiraceae bacterium]
MAYNVAIDGPAGAGKSTIAKKLAEKINFIYVDTGAMYRAIGLFILRNNISYDDVEAIKSAINDIDIKIEYKDNKQLVLLNGENVNDFIREEKVGIYASKTSKYECVRSKLLDLQKELARTNDVIMDGRDIGTTVLPDADVKIYLTASSKTRAKRRYDELVAKGVECDINVIEKDIIQRDEQDMNREISPLRQAEDAHLVDSSDMTIDEVVNYILENLIKIH